MTSQTGKQTIEIHILTNDTDRLLEYSLRNIFLEKPYIKCSGETISRPFSKKSKIYISLDQYSKALYILFLLFAKLRTIESD